MLGVRLWGGAKGNSHMGKGHRVGASVYCGYMSSFLLFFFVVVFFFLSFSCYMIDGLN